MATSLILFGLFHTASVVFAFVVLWRLYYYIRRYRFDESKYTLLFRFVHLRWIAASYLMLGSLWVVVSYLLFTRL